MSTSQTYRVTGMSCDHCKKAVESAVAVLPGVEGVVVDLAGSSVRIEGDAEPEAVRVAIEQAGYELGA